LVIAQPFGELGNRLFLFAHVVAAAIESGCRVANPCFADYADLFGSTVPDLWCRYPPRPSHWPRWAWLRRGTSALVVLLAGALRRSRPGLPGVRVVAARGETVQLDGAGFRQALRPGETVLLHGWRFRCKPLFRKHAAEIRAFFTPSEAHRRRVAGVVGEARERCEVLVGVHIRQGDYRQFAGGRHYFETPQYAEVMARVAALFTGRRVGFLICSNEPQDARHFQGFEHRFGTGHPVEDMYALAACDYLVAPMSTFSLWASFYGQTPVHVIADPRAPLTLAAFRPFNEDFEEPMAA
jgi:hypothetical protein